MKLSDHFGSSRSKPKPDTLEAYEYQSLSAFTGFSEDRLASLLRCGHRLCSKPASVVILHNPAGALPRCSKHLLAMASAAAAAELIVRTMAFTEEDEKLLDKWKTWPSLRELCRAAQVLKEGSILK